MNASDFKFFAGLPVSRGVRRTSLAAGVVSALLTGGLPFVGLETGVVMGRITLLPPLLAFGFHLVLALLYGAVFSLAVALSRDSWTLMAGGAATFTLYAANFLVAQFWGLPRSLPEVNAVIAHVIFGVAFTVFFKLAEIGAGDDVLYPSLPTTASSRSSAV